MEFLLILFSNPNTRREKHETKKYDIMEYQIFEKVTPQQSADLSNTSDGDVWLMAKQRGIMYNFLKNNNYKNTKSTGFSNSNRFVDIKHISNGTFGFVFKASYSPLLQLGDDELAIKMIPINEKSHFQDCVNEFARAKEMYELGVGPKVYEAFSVSERMYDANQRTISYGIVMKYYKYDLSKWIDERKPISEANLDYIDELYDKLLDNGYCCADQKPQNIVLNVSREDERVISDIKLIDFGDCSKSVNDIADVKEQLKLLMQLIFLINMFSKIAQVRQSDSMWTCKEKYKRTFTEDEIKTLKLKMKNMQYKRIFSYSVKCLESYSEYLYNIYNNNNWVKTNFKFIKGVIRTCTEIINSYKY